MNMVINQSLRVVTKLLLAAFITLFLFSLGTTNAQAYAGTLENGNLAYAQSTFNKGEACNYLPGFETGYDAWHFVLTSRGATFQQDPKNPAIAINLNIVYMRQDGSLFTIKSGAWVQTGKGAYTYTPVVDRIRIVQAGSLAQINGLDSGMRLSHTCPGTGSVVTPSASPTPTTSSTPTASPTSTATRSATPTPSPTTTSSPTPTATASPTATPSPTPTVSPSPTASASPSPTPTPSPSSTVIPTLQPRPNPTASAIQVHPTTSRSPLPTPTPTPQGIVSSPTPTPSPTSTPNRSSTPTPTPTPSETATEPNTPELTPLPTPPTVEDPKKVEFTEPNKPVDIDPKKFPEPPASPVIVSKEPTYGELKSNNNGTFTYTPPSTPPAIPVVDVVEFKYTNLSGGATIVRKEFVMIIKGDVPSIIQTGGNPTSDLVPYGFMAIMIVFIAGLIYRFQFKKVGRTGA